MNAPDFPARQPNDLTGTSVGRFAIRARLGSGGMGEVYRADDTQLTRTVAIKRLRPTAHSSTDDDDKLLREARRASSLNHSRIATVYDVFSRDDELFLVMEYVDGTTLRERLREPLALSDFLSIASQCAEAVEAAHSKGILHGDLKPSNIMLTRDGSVKVCDFGLARRFPTDRLSPDTITTIDFKWGGTPGYMAPEIVRGQTAGLSADLFSLGVVFYEALSGANPFASSSTFATLERVRTHAPEPLERLNPAIPPRLAKLVERLLEKRPEKRLSTATELRETLADIRAGLPELAKTRPVLPVPRRRFLAAAALALGALLVAQQLFERGLLDSSRATGLPSAINLAVLPFSVSGPDPARQALAQGLAEIISNKLARLTLNRPLQVAPAAELQARGVTSPSAAREELGSNLVLRGSLEYAGETVRITSALVETADGRELRRQELTASADDLLLTEDRVVEMVLRLMDLDIDAGERSAIAGAGTQLPGAYDYYLQARGYLLNFDRPENLDNAVAVFRKALEVDPRYALAYAGLGEAYWRKHQQTSETAWVEPARGACEGALSIAPELAESHACLGLVLSGIGEYERAVAEFTEAVTRDPTSDASHAGLATAYERLGRLDQAERTYRRAIELRPHYWGGYTALGAYLYRQGRFDDALEMFTQVVGLSPDSFRGYSSMGATYFMLDRSADAASSFERSLAIRPNYAAASNLGTLYYFDGAYRRSADAFRLAATLNDRSYQVWGNLAASLEALGDEEGALPAHRRALDLLRDLVGLNPRDAALQMAIADHHAALGDMTAARAALDEVLRLDPMDAHTLFLVGVFYEHRLGQRADSLAWLAKAVERGQAWREIDHAPELRELREDPQFVEFRAASQVER